MRSVLFVDDEPNILDGLRRMMRVHRDRWDMRFADSGLDYWVTGFGTGGTLKGVARVLKEKSPATCIVVCEPDNSQMLGSGIPQPRSVDGRVAGSHRNFRPHLMQGWSPDFVPKLTEDTVAMNYIDDVVPVNGGDA